MKSLEFFFQQYLLLHFVASAGPILSRNFRGLEGNSNPAGPMVLDVAEALH